VTKENINALFWTMFFYKTHNDMLTSIFNYFWREPTTILSIRDRIIIIECLINHNCRKIYFNHYGYSIYESLVQVYIILQTIKFSNLNWAVWCVWWVDGNQTTPWRISERVLVAFPQKFFEASRLFLIKINFTKIKLKITVQIKREP